MDPDLWDRFEAAAYEEQIALFRAALRAGELDSELAFEMLSQIAAEAAARQEPEQVAALVHEYAAAAPALYTPDAGYYVGWLLDAALARGRLDEIPALLDPFARDPVQWADELLRAADQLMYHGLTAPLVQTLQQGWARVRDRGDEALRAEYGELLGQLRLLAYLAERPSTSSDDPALWQAISPYLDADPTTFQENVRALLGTLGRAWQPRDFESAPRTEPRERRLWLLGWEWLGVVWREHRVPPSRGLLATETLLDYQTEQAERGKPKTAAALLVPAARRLDRFLGRYLTELTWRPYRAGALLGLLPLYLEFLVRRGLAGTGVVRRARAELAPLAHNFLRLARREQPDPLLLHGVAAAWDLVAEPESRD
ncbi:MAG TPA: hypothetical protein VKZ60_19475 [Chloroflexota bacterium]|nr:hypothetical protein [Chloroflexota bacterium]